MGFLIVVYNHWAVPDTMSIPLCKSWLELNIEGVYILKWCYLKKLIEWRRESPMFACLQICCIMGPFAEIHANKCFEFEGHQGEVKGH